MKSLKAKILLLVGVFVLMTAGIVGKTFITIAGQEDDGVILNVAGKQRMLIQKMMKEFNLVMNDTGEDEAAFEKMKVVLQETTRLFGKNLNGLLLGDKEQGLPPATIKDFKDKLVKVNEIWSKFEEVFKKGFAEGFFDEEQKFFNENEKFLRQETGEAVNIFVKASKNKVLQLKKVQTFFLVFILIGLTLLLLWFFKNILTPIKNVNHMIQELDHGNLSQRLKMKKTDEIGQMAGVIDNFADNLQFEVLAAFQKLSEGDFTFKAKGVIKEPLEKANKSLNDLMFNMEKAGEQIVTVSNEVSDSSQSLSQGATEQASSLEEITSSVEEMGSQTKQNAENATSANQLAVQARDAAEKGNGQMQGMVKAMEEINESSRNIFRIMKVIDEIAFQTNLLALNAAVEAARAGKHGKGFAVVADEVRNLAARSAKAAKETADLIEGSIKKVENGSGIANETAKALSEIVAVVAKVTNLVGEIAAASNEQAQGISQINQSLEQIDKVTQQTAAHAEESASAAEELASQASQFRGMLSHFKLMKEELMENGTEELEASVIEPEASLSHANSEEEFSEDKNKTRMLNPKDIIPLEDKEFGKY